MDCLDRNVIQFLTSLNGLNPNINHSESSRLITKIQSNYNFNENVFYKWKVQE